MFVAGRRVYVVILWVEELTESGARNVQGSSNNLALRNDLI